MTFFKILKWLKLNLSIVIPISFSVFQKDQRANIALVIALAFIIQAQSAAWYVKLSKHVFPSLKPAKES